MHLPFTPATSSNPPKDIDAEEGSFSVYRNIGKPSTVLANYFFEPKLYIKLHFYTSHYEFMKLRLSHQGKTETVACADVPRRIFEPKIEE
jgi:hypothetical protein